MSKLRNWLVGSLFITGAALFAPNSAFCQWQRTSGPEGGSITDFATDGDTIYAASGEFGASDIYKTTDLGDHWISIGANVAGTNPVIALSRTKNGKRLYAGGLNGLFRTTNDGRSWDSITPGLRGYHLTAIFASDSLLIAGASSEGVFQSTDDGVTWRAATFAGINPPTNFHHFLRTGSSILLTTQGQGIYRSDDNGLTWQASNGDLSGDDLFADPLYEFKSAIYAGTLRNVVQSRDGGLTWKALNNPSVNGPVGFADDGTTIYMNTGYTGVYSSVDQGNSWKLVGTGLPTTNNFKGLALVAGKLFDGAEMLGVFRESLADGIWSNASHGINNTTVLSLNKLTVSGVAALYAGTDDADFGYGWRTSDGGDTWSALKNLTDRGVHASAELRGTLYAGTDGEGIYRSTDDGANWSTAPNQVNGASYVSAFCVTPSSLLAGSTGFGTGVLRSTNQGANWLTPFSGSNQNITWLYYDSASRLTFSASAFGLAKSFDDGADWLMTNSKLDSLESYAVIRSGDQLLVGTMFGLYTSPDNGLTWSLNNSALGTARVFSLATSGDLVFAGTNSAVFVSRDHGNTWSTYMDSLAPRADILSLSTDDKFIYAGTSRLGLWRTPLPGSAGVPAYFAPQSLSITVGESEIMIENPFLDQHSIISIYDITGKEIRSVSADGGSSSEAISTSGMLPGVYIIRIVAPEKSVSGKFSILPH